MNRLQVWLHGSAALICLPIDFARAVAQGVTLGWRYTHTDTNPGVTVIRGPRYEGRTA